jgi:transcriptional regulator with XRE-family HTH domain
MMTIHNWYLDLDMSVFAERLKLLRKARNMTQSRLSQLLVIDPRAYSRWERGDNIPHLETLIKIADILQVTLDELVGRSKLDSNIRIRNHELNQLCQQADDLPDTDQQALIQILDGLMKKAQFSKMMESTAKG